MPVSVIGGYLGAGKTTIINHLLLEPHGRRLAVLVNDFGAVNVDADLIASHDGDTISLENGCVCCSIGDALGDAIDRVLAMENQPDQIVIEASGVADPAKVAIYGQGWPGCRLDAVVVVVDVETIRERAVDRFVGSTVTRQLQSGDLIVMTKNDLIDATEGQRVRDWLGTMAPGRPLVSAVAGVIAPETVLDLGAALGPDAGTRPKARSSDLSPDGPVEVASADEVFEAVHLSTDVLGRDLDLARLERALDAWPVDVVRIKGTVWLADGSSARRHLVQRVGARWSIEEVPDAPGAKGKPAGLVLIGLKGRIDLDMLLDVLRA